ncbi:MAG: hypothetical protein BTN85_2021 [Candidatus Methanohalarchaeum thermophilum]|uniref:Uncharacterized protein n=1 Tax=Methanohalarchaeum thermophilum TaxID=1903181 RepID=A0A1Q6DSR0_METT1|nr:MAG: hypothetical protein BTN85_2021 [Candidatus Methanohalarchaeum thermophilum]
MRKVGDEGILIVEGICYFCDIEERELGSKPNN